MLLFMNNAEDCPTFEEVFRFRTPTPEEVNNAAEDLMLKMRNDGLPVGTQAFFSSDDVLEVSMQFISQTGDSHAEEYNLNEEDARMIVYAEFIGALELMAAIRLRIED